MGAAVTARTLVVLLALAALGWFGLVVLAPTLPSTMAAAVYGLGSLVCHQRPERSFHWAGAQLAVCARCTGIYAGSCAAVALVPLRPRRYRAFFTSGRRARALLVGAALPTIVTAVLEWSGWWTPSSLTRAVAGVPLGLAVAVVLAGGLSTIASSDGHSADC